MKIKERRNIEDSPRAAVNNTRPVAKNMVVLECSMDNCDVEVHVHKKDFASLANCGKENCPNGKKS